MHPVIRRGCKDIFYDRMRFPDVFSVHPELKQYGDLVGDKNDDGMKPDHTDGQKENDLDVLDPA